MSATVTVRFLRGTGLGESGFAAPGDVRELDSGTAHLYVAQGRVVVVNTPPESFEAPEVSFEAPEVPIENRDPALRRRKGRN